MSENSVTVIGAGITGPTTALVLAQKGYSVTVREQRPPNALFSTGIIGVTQDNWDALSDHGVTLQSGELLNRTYRDYETGITQSPFRLIVWTDLHDSITQAAINSGVHVHYNVPPIPPDEINDQYVIDAGGIVSAARRKLPRIYLGSIIYRGISSLHTPEGFTTYKLPHKRGFLDIGDTHNGAAWAFGVRRPQPEHFRTTVADGPPEEVNELPEEFQDIIRATPRIMSLPQAGWTVATTIHNDEWTRFTLGDANGPVRPITTAGANLAIQAGLESPLLLHGSENVAASLLRRRSYALALGLRLTGPEIGGLLEDPNFYADQDAMYEDGLR